MKAKCRQTRVYEKDHLGKHTPAAKAAGFFFAGRCVVSLFVLHISLERKNPQKIRVFEICSILRAEKQKRRQKYAKR